MGNAGLQEQPTGARRERSRRGEGAALRDDILDAASRLLLQHGDEEKVTVRAVAAEVGVSPPSVYLHFPDKDALIFAVCERLFARIDRVIEDALDGKTDPLERMAARALAYARFGVEHPEEYRVLFMHKPEVQPEHFGPDELKSSAAFSHLVDNVHELVAAGVLDPGIDPWGIGIELWALVHGITSLCISHPSFGFPPLEEMVGSACKHLFHGLARRDG